MKEKAYAKINLSLNITGKDTYLHTLDSVMATVDLYDEVEITRGESGITVTAESPFSDFVPELFTVGIQRVVNKFFARYGVSDSLKIHVVKNIPIGGGLGSSSADIACVVSMLADMFYVTVDNAFLLSLGSDVPFMYTGGIARCSGYGEVIVPLPFVDFYCFIVKPEDVCITSKVYKLYDEIGGSGETDNDKLEDSIRGDGSILNVPLGNMLTESATKLCPEIEIIIGKLKGAGFANSMLTGSGSCVVCLGVSPSDANRLYELFPQNTSYFCKSTRLAAEFI